MANLTISIGALTAQINADNAKAQEVVSLYADAIGATGTNQQRLQTVVQGLARHMRETAQRQRRNADTAAALAAAEAAVQAVDWS